MKSIKVLVVDDSPLIRSLLRELLGSAPDITIVGEAEDPYDAREKIKHLNPDVLTLDIEMPKMDGLTFLKNLMRLRPMPVIMISTLTQEGAPQTLEALEIGAVDYLAKPQKDVMTTLVGYQSELHDKVRAAAGAVLKSMRPKREPYKPKVDVNNIQFRQNMVIAIGASTGGTEAIKEVISRMPASMPPIVIAQHIPPVFSTSYAMRLDRSVDLTVHEASNGQRLEVGNVYIAPGHSHLRIRKEGSYYYTVLDDGPEVNRHKPSVEVLFDSVREQAGKRSVAAILTGMGADGASALLRLREAGVETIAQDEKTSVVWGMPGAAVSMNAAGHVLPLEQIADQIMSLTQKV